ncbi:TetR/AcrR family transcriptional regulator [Amycolatopsis sp. cg5]|uniref:TetR/AcrR family transcriptional regulator n=1 Tax=Amycolatopsis sp. cg5 TaxID=3238802 RepID=UPI00352579A7
MGKRTDSRDRTVAAAEHLFRARGVTGTGLRDIVEAAGTARGALGHHFPGGKEELVLAVIDHNMSRTAGLLREAAQTQPRPSPSDVVRLLVGFWRDELLRTDYALGCPLVAMVVDDVVNHPQVRTAVATALSSLQDPLATLLSHDDTTPSPGLAMALLAGVEGAVVLSRAHRSVQPLDEVEQVFLTLTAREGWV